MTLSLDDLVRHLPQWANQPLEVRPLSGGITNANYLVQVGDTPWVLRVAGRSSELLGVDRAAEVIHTRVAAELGLGPALVAHLPEPGWTVLEFLPGQTLTEDDLRRPGMPRQLGALVRHLHQAQGFIRAFDMLAWIARYRAQLQAWGAPLPEGLAQQLGRLDRLAELFQRWPAAAVACHNDLLAGNLIDTPGGLRIVDYEYSGWNDPFFELGNTAQEQQYNPGQLAELCQGYFGHTSEPLTARVWLNMIVSDLGWSLWAAIQARVSALDFDFEQYGAGRWQRALAKLDSPEFVERMAAADRPVPTA